MYIKIQSETDFHYMQIYVLRDHSENITMGLSLFNFQHKNLGNLI